MLRDTKGLFTLIELLVVVVIISMLAAITISQYPSTKKRAFDATAKSDLRNAMTSQEAYFADTQVYAPNAMAFGVFTTSTGITNSSSAASAVEAARVSKYWHDGLVAQVVETS